MPTRSEPSAKRQRKEELLSIFHLLMDSPVAKVFVGWIDYSQFGRLLRCCKSFKASFGVHTQNKINQLVEAVGHNPFYRIDRIARLFRMYYDKQLTETQYRRAYNAFHLKFPNANIDVDTLFNPDNRTASGELIKQIPTQRADIRTILEYIKFWRYPTPLDFLLPGSNAEIELALQGYELPIIQKAALLRPPFNFGHNFSYWHNLNDINFYTTNQLCQRYPQYYKRIPKNILNMLFNEPGGGSLRQIPGLISLKLFLDYRKYPYTLEDVKCLGFSANDFIAFDGHYFDTLPISVIEWIHQSNSKFLWESESLCMMLATANIVEESIYQYIADNDLLEDTITKLTKLDKTFVYARSVMGRTIKSLQNALHANG
jgi:hypothetical protein